jgi:integrase
MNPKTLQYLMGHSEISVTMDTYTHLGLQDAWEELRRIQLNDSQKEMGLRLVKTA